MLSKGYFRVSKKQLGKMYKNKLTQIKVAIQTRKTKINLQDTKKISKRIYDDYTQGKNIISYTKYQNFIPKNYSKIIYTKSTPIILSTSVPIEKKFNLKRIKSQQKKITLLLKLRD